MNKEDTELAINAASEALPAFRKLNGRQRGRMLHKWYTLMMDNAEDLAKIITWENGKPLADSRGEVSYAASFFEWFAEEAPRTYGDTIPASVPGNRIFTVKEPVGVVGLITPWNFPAAMVRDEGVQWIKYFVLKISADHSENWTCSGRWMHSSR